MHKTVSILRSARSSVCSNPIVSNTDNLDELILTQSAKKYDNLDDLADEDVKLDMDQLLSSSIDNKSKPISSNSIQSKYEQQPMKLDSVSDSIIESKLIHRSAVSRSPERVGQVHHFPISHEIILRLIEPDESLRVTYRCARIQGLDVYEGLLIFGQNHFYIIDGYTLINTNEIVEIDLLDAKINHEPIVPSIHIKKTKNREETNVDANHSRFSHNRPQFSMFDIWSSGAVSHLAGKQ